jgi:hypothetical protein
MDRISRRGKGSVEQSESTSEDVAERLGSADVPTFVRAVVANYNEDEITYVQALVGGSPPSWKPSTWLYARATFAAGEVSSRELAACLSDQTVPLLVEGISVTLPPLHDQASQRREASLSEYTGLRMQWPTTNYELSALQARNQTPSTGYLIGDGCPSFFTFEQAIRAFFLDQWGTFGPDPRAFSVVVRVAERSGWLSSIRILPTHIEATLEGESLGGTTLELNSPTWRISIDVSSSNEMRVPLPAGLPSGSTLFLKRAGDWLDFRSINPRAGRDELRTSGIELVHDPTEDLRALIYEGEGPQVEFKSMPPSDPETKRGLLKTVVAFANSWGGSLVIGVDDDGKPVGIESDARRVADDIMRLIHGRTDPEPDGEAFTLELEGKSLILVNISRGTRPPYGFRPPGSEHLQYYVRRGANSFPASATNIREATLAAGS